jgi:hypothetical protein
MADGVPTGGLWSWSAEGRIDPADVRAALAGSLARPVTGLDSPAPGAMLCDVWHVGGDYPTSIECFGAPVDVAEPVAASAVAVRLGAGLLLPDESLNPTRYLLAARDGTLRFVHVEEIETDEGTERRRLRPCTGSDPACAEGSEKDAA